MFDSIKNLSESFIKYEKKYCMIRFAYHQLRIAILMYVNTAMIFDTLYIKTLEEVFEENEILSITTFFTII
jgi:hypothetical protein